IMACKGLQMLMGASRYLCYPIMQFIGNMVPLLFEQFGSLMLDDILKHNQVIDGLPILITKKCSGKVGPERFMILPQVALFQLVASNLSFKRLFGKKHIFSDVIWMGNGRDAASNQLLFAISQHLTEGPIHLQQMAFRVRNSHTNRNFCKNVAKALLTLFERPLYLYAFGNITQNNQTTCNSEVSIPAIER